MDHVLSRKRRIPVITVILIVLNALGMLYEFAAGEENAIYSFAMYQGALQDGEWQRLVVSAFLHFGFTHFASNMFCLGVLGSGLEERMSRPRYALIYAVSILGSGLLINFAGGNGIHAGASGAIWGLMTATLVYNVRNGFSPIYALRGIVINIIYSFSAGVSWQGHIGGGIAGFLAALAMMNADEPAV